MAPAVGDIHLCKCMFLCLFLEVLSQEVSRKASRYSPVVA